MKIKDVWKLSFYGFRFNDQGHASLTPFVSTRIRHETLFQRTHLQSKDVDLTKSMRGGASQHDDKVLLKSTTARGENLPSKKLSMYLACMGIVLIWITIGTLFYSRFNNWPLPQSFFYAVDAGMSIGFCTDVAEKTVGSRAFTIIYIILGASCVGGALFLFIKDIMERIVHRRNKKFETLLAQDAISRLDPKDNHELEIGVLDRKLISYQQFRTLVEEWTGKKINDTSFRRLCRRFDPHESGFILSSLFLQKCHEFDLFVCTTGPIYSENWMIRHLAQIWQSISELWDGQYINLMVLNIWVGMGIYWGVKRQGWDPITATHFAISALATGGLTAPEVNERGILPTEPAIFCGIYCLFGIPLFALTLGNFARILVEEYVDAVEEKKMRSLIQQPLQAFEFEYAKHLCTPEDPVIHLSDFIVLQLLKQNKIDIRLVDLIKGRFNALDVDGKGFLELQQAKSNMSSSLSLVKNEQNGDNIKEI